MNSSWINCNKTNFIFDNKLTNFIVIDCYMTNFNINDCN